MDSHLHGNDGCAAFVVLERAEQCSSAPGFEERQLVVRNFDFLCVLCASVVNTLFQLFKESGKPADGLTVLIQADSSRVSDLMLTYCTITYPSSAHNERADYLFDCSGFTKALGSFTGP
jgi:hypothetical protein